MTSDADESRGAGEADDERKEFRFVVADARSSGKIRQGLDRLRDALHVDFSAAGQLAYEVASKEQAVSVSKEELVQIAHELRAICGDSVYKDGEILARMIAWVDGLVDEAREARATVESDRERMDGIMTEATRGGLSEARKRTLRAEIEALKTTALIKSGLPRAVSLGNFIVTKDGQLSAVCLARWAANGYPQIVMGHRYAAALLATNISADVLELVKPPWNGFVIEVPNGLLTLWHPDLERRVPVTRILVAQHANKHGGEHAWMYVAMTETVMTLWRFGVTTSELLPPTLENDMFKDDPTNLEIDDADRRVQSLIGRLIVNVCLAMSDPEFVKAIGPGHKRFADTERRRLVPEPVVRTFQLGRPVKVDYRQEIAAYVEGGTKARRAVNKQWLVAGHYKRQHHGPKNSLVKVIWREPYWVGPDDAPILVRPHVLVSNERTAEPERGARGREALEREDGEERGASHERTTS